MTIHISSNFYMAKIADDLEEFLEKDINEVTGPAYIIIQKWMCEQAFVQRVKKLREDLKLREISGLYEDALWDLIKEQ